MQNNSEVSVVEGDLFRNIFENANDGILILDIKGKVLLANQKAISLAPEGTIHKGIRFTKQNIFNDRTKKKLRSFFDRTIEKGSEEEEIKASFVHGESGWFNLSSSVIKENGTGSKKIIIIISDISKQKKYAEMLRENQMRYKMVVENLHEGLGIIDNDERIVYANPAFCKMLGYTDQQILNMNISDVVQHEEFKLRSQSAEKIRKGIHETWVTTSNGAKKRILLSTAPGFSEKGDYKGSAALLLDITGRIINEKTLKENEERYRATVEQSAENIYIYDVKKGKVVESNKALQDLLGYTAKELEGMKASDFVAHTSKNIGKRIDEVIEKGHLIIGERSYIKKDGTYVDVEVSASHLTQGNRSMLCVVSRDITERKLYQAQLIEEKNRAEFYLDLLAHDMGNLLHGIDNGLEAFEMVRGNPSKERNILNLLRSLTGRSIKLTGDVITFSRSENVEVDLKEIDLGPMASSAIKAAERSFPEVSVSLSLDMGALHTVYADEFLEKVFFNLFHNSIKAQHKDKAIIGLRTSKVKNGTLIEIWDHGGGISEDMKPMLFDRLENVELKRHSGMGMAIVHITISRYNGTIDVEDLVQDGVVIGSLFKIILPSKE